MARMSQLQRWEALRAVSYLMASDSDSLHTEPRAKISGQKEALRDDLETVLLRLEKKVEDSKQQLEAMNNALTRSSQDQEPRETDPATQRQKVPSLHYNTKETQEFPE
ncbi:hypothetical protein ACOMHN_012534 [Nucella lapillus]